MLTLSFVLCSVFLITLMLRYWGDIAHPSIIFTGMWGGTMLLHWLLSFTLLPDILEVSLPTFALFLGGILFFAIGGLTSKYFFGGSIRVAPISNAQGNHQVAVLSIPLWLRIGMLALLALLLPGYINKAYSIVLGAQTESFLRDLRWQLTFGEADYGIYKYVINISILAYGFCLVESIYNPTKLNKAITIISFLIAIVYVIFFTGRTLFFMLLILYIFGNLISNPKFNLSKLIILVLSGLGIFIIYGLILDKGGDINSSWQDNLTSVSELTGLYLVGGPSALQYEISNLLEVQYKGTNSLRLLYLIGESIGITPPYNFKKTLIQEFVYIPYETNVFTFYSPYLRDFGYFYPLLMLYVFGFIHSYFYYKVKQTNSKKHTLYYALLMYPIIMSVFSDQYLSILSNWIQIIVIIELVFYCSRIFQSRSRPVLPDPL